MFFSFDGIDGVGKTTQMQLFQSWLSEKKLDVVTCRDPGSTSLGERVRDILLKSDESTPISPRSEMLLYMAARAQLVAEIIRPALEAGKIVISDRYLLANIVYQGYAGGLEVGELREVGRIATTGIMPDCTFLLDMAPAAARGRMGRELDRIEQRGDNYRDKLRSGFLAEAQFMGNSVHLIDATRSIETIQTELRTIATGLIG
jgi:dTMP kinase